MAVSHLVVAAKAVSKRKVDRIVGEGSVPVALAVRIGEISGTETESLDRLAEQYQDRAKRALNTIAMIASFTIWLTIILVIGGIVLYMGLKYIQLIYDALP